MSKDIKFFSHLMLMAAGVLAIGGFVLLMLIFQPRNKNPKIIENDLSPNIDQEKLESDFAKKVYFDEQNIFSDEDFSFHFYYPQDWFVTDNGDYKKDGFLNLNPDDILAGWIISTFNNPDYQLGKQAALIVKVIANPDKKNISNWLNEIVLQTEGELISGTVGSEIYYYTNNRQQIYTQLPSGEFLIFTAPCGVDSKCLGDKEKNQEIFETVLSSLSF